MVRNMLRAFPGHGHGPQPGQKLGVQGQGDAGMGDMILRGDQRRQGCDSG